MHLQEKKILVLAPHLTSELMDGAEILIFEFYLALSMRVKEIHVVAFNEFIILKNRHVIYRAEYSNDYRNSKIAALRCILFRTNYLYEKWITKKFQRKVGLVYNHNNYDILCASMIVTGYLAEPLVNKSEFWVETHNHDPTWFDNLRKNSKNPFLILAALQSKIWINKVFKSLSEKALFIHVSSKDKDAYTKDHANHNSIVREVGCKVPLFTPSDPGCNNSLRLLFCGSLGNEMNKQALLHFHTKFWPIFKNSDLSISIRIVGSNPSVFVMELCEKAGWEIFKNQTNSEIDEHFQWAHFSLLPFNFSTGSKLKLIKSLSLSTPFLATSAVYSEKFSKLSRCIFSDDPTEWLESSERILKEEITNEQQRNLHEMALKYDWTTLANKFVSDLTV